MDFKAWWQWLINLFSSPVVVPTPEPVPTPVPPPVPPTTDPPPITPVPPVVTPPPVVVPPVVTPPPPPPPPVTPKFRYPADVFGKAWKLTLEDASEIKQPELATYTDSNFKLSSDGKGASMRAHYGAGHTSGSLNPRCELREMKADGKTAASWSCKSGTHKIVSIVQVDRLTEIRPHLVISQIHGSKDDVSVWRVEGSSLWLTVGDNNHGHLVTSSFKLGVPYTLEYNVSGGVISYRFNGQSVPWTLKASDTGCYAKVGAYVQANSKTAPGGSSSDYGQVTVYGATVTHS